MPSSLRHMEFDASPSDSQAFQISSKDLQQHQHLRILRLLDFSKLENLPEELGDRVKGLQELSLTNCKSIKKLPDSISKLPFLRILKMDNCSNLTELPVDFGSLSSLQELNLSGCQQLNALPDSVDKLSSLKLLNLSRCFQLLNLPQGLGKLTCLVELHLEFCFNLQSIPDSIGELKLLRALNLGYCRNLKELPDGFCNLSFITHLSFTACFSLEKLPDGFGQLKSLKVLDMIYCQTLHKLPEGFGQLKNLERLHLAQCSKLRELCNDFHCLSSLQQLDLTWCTTLEKLPENFHFLTSLQKLDLSWCPKLEGKSMDHVAKMNTLQVVDIRGSNELVKRWAEIQSDCHGSSYPYVIISEEKPTLSENVKENMKSNLKDVDANLKVSGATHCDEAPSSGSPNVPVDAKLNVSGAPSCNEAPSSSSSSSRVETTSSSSRGASKSAVINTILHKDIEEVDGKKVDVKIDELMKHISELLKLREEEMRLHKTLSNPSSFPWPSVSSLKNLKELLSSGLEVASALKDITSGTITTVLKDIGQASVATAGLLVVAYTLERFHDVSTNKEKCWDLIKEMSYVGSVVQRLKDSPKGTQEDVIEQATALVVEGAIICCTQIGRSACKSFFTASKDKDDLSDMRQKLNVKYMQINIEIGFRVLTAIEGKGRSPLSKRYPTHAVGIDEPVKEVLRLLEIESDKNAVTVILHGFGGMGKTTLADAVFSHVGGCKYSKVRLFKDINSTPVIEELQKEILEDLMEPGENIPEIRTHEDGQRELELVLKRVQAFIYIDNVLEGAELRKLLPSNMSAAKKVRILLTARDQNVNMACPLPCTKPEIYKLKGIKDEEAMIILQKEIKEGISDIQFKDIIQTCGGIPLMLTLTAPFIGRAPNKQEAYNTVMLQKEKWTGEHFKEMRYAFAYDALPRDCREPFLDICSYFKGWDWQTVQDIVGKDKLEMLESRALVTRTTNDVASVHDVILTLAQQKSKEESKGKEVRLTFNSARELEQLLQEEGAAEGIKGIWLSNNNDVLNIPATTLNLMHESLRVLQLGKLVMVEGKWSETFKELVFFEAKVEQLPFQDVSKLKQLRYLSYEPINEPNDLKLSKMPSSLRHMEIDGKSHRHAFQISSNALQQLEHLRILRLVNFSKLKNLPEKLGHQVKRLHELSLSKCRSITKLPDSISNLQSLQILKMDGCRELTKLPDDFGSLSSLRELHLHECSDLEALPESAEKLSSLTLLNLSCCVRLSNFPPCVGNLTRLVELNLEGCRDLKSIPEGIGELKLLRALYVSFCETLTELPDGLCNLSFITHLKFSWCLRLKKLPDRFGQLASLKVLELRWCKSLQKLPEGFGQLKNLEVLDLQKCDELEELCNDFHCLSSLQNLNLSGCYSLEGKSMDHMVKMNRLQLIVHIEGSIELEKRWAELIERDGDAGSRSLTVISGQDFSISRVNEKENIEKNLLSELDGLLTNGRREKFHLSELPANTLILVMWQFPSFIEEMIDDELQTKIIYIGPDFDEFSTEVKNNIFVVDVPTTRAKEMLEKVHLTLDLALDDSKSSLYLQIDRRMVGDGQRDEYRPCWRLLTNREMEEFVVCNCNRYLRLKQLADEEDEESNIGLLRALFAPQGDETTPVFQKNESSQQHPTPNSEPKAKSCGVDKLEGKTILLEMRPPDSFDHDIRLPSLKDMYLREKDRLNFEIISIPLVKPRQERDEYRIPYTVFELFEDFKREVSDVFDVYKQFSREVPWLVLQNPWMTITRAVQYFLAKHCTTGWEEIQKCEKWYPTINWIIDPKGRITIYSPSITPRDRGEVFEVLFKYLESESYQVRWGVNASLTTLGEIEEVRKKEWQQLKNMSTLEFLFNHLKSVQVKLKDLMFQGKFICLCRGSSVEEIACSMEQFRDSIHFIHVSHQVRVLWLASIISKKYYYPLENTTEMEGTSLLKLSRHESVSFIMRLHHLEEEINGMDESDKHLWELKSLLHSLLFDGSIALFDKGGNSVAAITGRDVESIFLSDRKDRAERLIKTMMKDSQIIKKMQTASAAAVEQQSVDDVYFDALRDYISELWGVQLYQLLKFKKEEKKRSPPRVTWPTSRGFCRLKNLLSEGANDDWVKDVISRHSEEDACHTIIKSVLKEIEEAEWAVAGLLAVAELLERMVTVPNDHRIKWLFVVDEMFRLAQYCKQFNEKDELWRRMKCGAIAVILIYSIGCCCLIDPSKFEFSYRRKVDSIWLRNVERELRKECDKLDQTRIEYLDNESGSLAKLMCYRRGFELWPESEDEGGPSSVHERSASFPKAGSTGLTGEEESEDELGPESENEGEDELGPESEDDGENESEDELGPESEDEDGPSSVHESSASFPKAGSTGSTGEEE